MTFTLHSDPPPLLISDKKTRTLNLFGGVIPEISSSRRINKNEVGTSLAEFLESLSPLIDDAYRADLSAYRLDSKVVTHFEPLRKKLRSYPSSIADWRVKEIMSDFRTLQGIVLQNFIEGRHTTFGFKPNKNQLLFIHILNKDGRKIHEFLGELQLKILHLVAKRAKIHYFNQQDSIFITAFIEELSEGLENKPNDSMTYI